MTKEEKIKEAWGVYFEHLSEHATKHALENEGFCYIPACTLGLILRKYGEEWLETNKDLKNRPKSLQGIENNNGWLEIKDEDDLPYCDFEDLWVFINDKVKLYSEVVRLRNLESGYFETDITYYQPIEKPKPPIY